MKQLRSEYRYSENLSHKTLMYAFLLWRQRHYNLVTDILGEFFFFFHLARHPPSGPGLPHSRVFWTTHDNTPQLVGLHWTNDQLVAETSI